MRVSSGVPGFDELIAGGFLDERLYVISGPPGSGKTTFCAHFVTAGATSGDNCLYVTMHETEAELREDMAGFEFGFERALASDQIQFLNLITEGGRRRISQFGSDGGLTNRLASFVEAKDVDRVVVDSTMLLQHFFADRSEEITSFLTALKRTEATTLLISETTDPTAYSDEHYLAHGVVFFHNFLEAGEMTRGIQVLKMRGTPIDCDIRELAFESDGLRINPGRKVEA